MKARARLPRGKPPRPSRVPIPKIGRARRRKAQRRAEVIDTVWARDDGRCQALPRIELARMERFPLFSILEAPRTCGGQLEVHEIAQRSVYPNGELDEDNCLLVCRRHHVWIDANQTAAQRLGLHAWSWSPPAERGKMTL